MSSSFVKAKLKAARDAISKKEYKTAQEVATQVLEYEPNNYNANVFLGLACLELDDHAASELAYKRAIDANPDQALAWQGLSKFYERTERWQDFGDALRHLMDVFANQKDSMKCAESLQKYIEFQKAHGTREQVIQALGLLLPSSKLHDTLCELPEPEPTAHFASTTYEIQVSIHNSLPTLEEIASLLEREEEGKIKKEVERRRMRLGAGRPEDIKKEVVREVLGASTLASVYNEILNHPKTSDELRRTTESKLLRRTHQHLKSVPSSGKDSDLKSKLLSEVENLIDGMVLLGIPDELAWTIFFEGREEYDYRNLRRFFEIFPSSSMTKLFQGYFRYKDIPISLGDSEDDEEVTEEGDGHSPEHDPFGVVLEAFEDLPKSLLAHRVVSELYSLEFDYENAIKMGEGGIELVDRFEADYGKPHARKVFTRPPLHLLRSFMASRVRKEFMTILAIGLVHHFPPKHHTRALKLLDKILERDPDNISCLMGRGYVLQHSAQWSAAENVFCRVNELQQDVEIGLEAQEEQGWCQINLGKLDESINTLQVVIQTLDGQLGKEYQKARAWWRLGRALWDQGSKEEAYKYFITSLKRSSDFAPAFTSLGIYYAEVAAPPDLDRSSKCFQKAFELDAREGEAARRLAEGFAEEREWDLVEVIARRTIEGEGGLQGEDTGKSKSSSGNFLPTNAWAWKALGVVELNKRNYSSATRAFQVALRSDEDDFVSWQRLGESYAKSGRHVASLKALQKALELRPTDWMCLYLMGEVHRSMGQYQVAIDLYEDVLKIRPTEICVLAALAETHLAHGQNQSFEGFLARAEASFIASLRTAIDILDKSPGFRRIAWKTAADSTIQLSKYDFFNDPTEVHSSLSALASLMTLVEKDTMVNGVIELPLVIDGHEIGGIFAAQLAVAAYSYRISLGSINDVAISSAWFDLGVALSHFKRLTQDNERSTLALQRAVHCFQKSLDLDPGNTDCWNALGNHHFVENPKLSQNAYIRALEFNPKSALTWTNLGLLYLYHGDVELANEALYRAQIVDSEFALAWAGQGLVATANGHHIDSVSLFEHATNLSAAVPSADLEYAKRSFKTIVNVRMKHSMESLLPPFHSLERYCQRRQNDATALHLFGLVCERLNLMNLAVDLIGRSIAILERSYEETEDAITEERFAIANGNLGRLRLSIEDYHGAIEAFNITLSLLSAETDDSQTKTLRAHARFGTGLAQFKIGELESALGMFETALDELPSENVDVRGHVSILLSQTLWALGSDEAREAARGQLLECISADPANLTAMASLVAMGTLGHDDVLVDAALSEMRTLTPDKRAELDPGRIVSRLRVKHHLIEAREKAAIGEAQRPLHEQPLDNKSRRFLASLLLQRGDAASAATVILGESITIDRDSGDESLRIAAVAAARCGISDRALRLAQKAVMFAPWSKDNWEALAYIRCTQSSDPPLS